MPEIPSDLINSVVILLMNERPIGTAFVMKNVVIDENFSDEFYLVTCEHCVDKPVMARFSNGSTLTIQPNEWRKSTSGDDVVVIDITCLVTLAGRAIGCINTECTVKLGEPFFGIGSDLYMLGLLVDEVDIGENLPRARFGNLSSFADKRVLSEQGNGARRPCHLGDMRSRTGFSGSPVIGYLEIPALDGHTIYKSRLFGVHSAQHKERVIIYSESDYKSVEIPSSMTRIVPAWIILGIIKNDKVFAQNRAYRKSTR